MLVLVLKHCLHPLHVLVYVIATETCGSNPHICCLRSNEAERVFLRKRNCLKIAFSLFIYEWKFLRSYISRPRTSPPEKPFTFSLFAGANYHTLFCSRDCYNPLLIFFYYHHKLSASGARREMCDCTNKSSDKH